MEPVGQDEGAVLFYESRYYLFSNFSSFMVEVWGRVWQTAEHAYQAAKFFDDKEIQDLIFHARSAHDAKKIARTHQGRIRLDWEDAKLRLMEHIINAKIAQHPYVCKMLLQTGSRPIIEDSPKDSFWGWGPDKKGLNHLGKIWMKERAFYKREAVRVFLLAQRGLPPTHYKWR